MERKSFIEVILEPQNIIALGVTMISVCALIVSIRQTQIMAEQRELLHEAAKAAVWPRLQIYRGKGHRREDYQVIDYKLFLVNAGVGPAIITDVRVSYKGKPTENWWTLFEEFNLPDSVETFITNSSINQSIVKIGEEAVFFDLGGNQPLANQFYKHEDDVKIEVWYRSIYGDKWKLTYGEEEGIEEVESEFALPKEEQFDG